MASYCQGEKLVVAIPGSWGHWFVTVVAIPGSWASTATFATVVAVPGSCASTAMPLPCSLRNVCGCCGFENSLLNVEPLGVLAICSLLHK